MSLTKDQQQIRLTFAIYDYDTFVAIHILTMSLLEMCENYNVRVFRIRILLKSNTSVRYGPTCAKSARYATVSPTDSLTSIHPHPQPPTQTNPEQFWGGSFRSANSEKAPRPNYRSFGEELSVLDI